MKKYILLFAILLATQAQAQWGTPARYFTRTGNTISQSNTLDTLKLNNLKMPAGTAGHVLTINSVGNVTTQAVAAGADSLADLPDVSIVGATSGNILMRRASGKWVDTSAVLVSAGGWTDNGTTVTVTTASDIVGIGGTPTSELHIQMNSANTSNEGIRIEQAGAGDAAITWIAGSTYSMGIDNSTAGDQLVISKNATLGTTTNSLVVSTARIGINRVTPSFALDIDGASDAEANVRVGNTADGQSISFGWNTGGALPGINFDMTLAASSNDLRIETTNYTSGTGGDIILDAGGSTADLTVERANGTVTINALSIGSPDATTLAAIGSATVTAATYHTLDTFSSAALDTATTLTGVVGQLLYLRTTADARDITFLDSGNFSLGAERLLDDTDDLLVLLAITATTYIEVSFISNN